jgi:hypothetical protein
MMAKTKPSWAKVTGPLAEYADGFRAELFRLGYTPLTAACQIRLTAHLNRWLTAECLAAQDLDMPAAERYFAARRLAGYANERTTGALVPLLGYLRRLRAAPPPPAEPATETSLLLDRFAAYLASERGLAPATVTLNVRLARPFLQQRALGHDGHHRRGQVLAACLGHAIPCLRCIPCVGERSEVGRYAIAPAGFQVPCPGIGGLRREVTDLLSCAGREDFGEPAYVVDKRSHRQIRARGRRAHRIVGEG